MNNDLITKKYNQGDGLHNHIRSSQLMHIFQLTFTLYKDDKWETMAWPDFIKIEDKKKKPTTTFKIECKSASNTWTNKFRILDTV